MADAEARTYPDIVAEEVASLGEDNAKSVVQAWLGKAEDLYLDFKMKDLKQMAVTANDQRNLAKAISGFGNSDGGLLVWGVEARKKAGDPESPDVASELKPIEKVSAFHATLNHLIRDATKPVVPGVVNYRIYEDRNEDRGYVITVVRPGDHPPYRAEYDNNNHFYKRAGSRFYPMEPYDLRDVVFRRSYPKVEVELSHSLIASHPGRHLYSLVVVLRNRGPVSLSGFRIDIRIPQSLIDDVDRVHDTSQMQRLHALDYRRLSVTRPSMEYPIFRLFPEDELVVVGGSSGSMIRYHMNYDLFTSPVRSAEFFTLYGENMPPLSGSKPVAELIQF